MQLLELPTLRKKRKALKIKRYRIRLAIKRLTTQINTLKAMEPSLSVQRIVTPEQRQLFSRLCSECGAFEEIVKARHRYTHGKRMYHVRAYIAWSLRYRYGLKLQPIAELMRGENKTHASLYRWIQDAQYDPKYQRPPMEGEYAN